MSSRRARGTRRRRLGVLLMSTSMLAALSISIVGPAVAQEAAEPVAFESLDQIALFASPRTDGVPNTVVNSFPPQVVCVIQPAFCTEESAPIRDPITGLLQEVDQSAQPEPVQATQPDTLTFTYTAGNIDRQSGLTFPLPPVPDGHKIDSFMVMLTQVTPSYSGDSPAFRQAVLAAVAAAGSRDPAVFQEEFMKALGEEQVGTPQIGIEACPFKSPYPIVPNEGANEDGTYANEPAEPGSGAPPTAASDTQIPQQDVDGDGLPEPNVECLFGASGVYDEATATWTFDLTFALQAWIDGDLATEGLLMRPTGAPNLAFGDPDTSFNAQATLDATSAAYTLETSEPPPPIAPLAPLAPLPPAPAPTTAPVAPAPVAPAPAPITTTTTSGGGFSAPLTDNTFGSAPVAAQDAPIVATPEEAPVVAQEAAPAAPVAAPLVPEQPGYYWFLWLLIPLFMTGMYLTSGALTSEELVGDDELREGAMTRLLQNQQPAGFARTV